MLLKDIITTIHNLNDKFFVKNKDLPTKVKEIVGKHYSVIIDFSLSDPATMITYADDEGCGAMSTDWFDILGLKLCVLKDGVVQYYLNPNNVAQKLDGSAADITTLGNDVMLEIPKMGTNCVWVSANKLKITITTAPDEDGYDYRAFSLHSYNDCDKIYIARYHAYLSNNMIYSSSGKTPIVEKTLANYRTYATNRGTGYTDIGICDNMLLQCLYLLIVRHFNSQSVIGAGITGDTGKHNTGEANTFGWLNSYSSNKTSDKTAVCCLGIENFFGNIWVWEDGIIKTATNTMLMARYADQYNSDGTNYETVATNVPMTETDTTNHYQNAYMGRFAGLPKFIFMPNSSSVAASGRGATTYVCDWTHVTTNILTISDFGGDWPRGALAGAFYRGLSSAPSDAYSRVGSRLVYKRVS